MRVIPTMAVIACLAVLTAAAQNDPWPVALVASNARLEQLAGGFAFTEGPTANAQGDVFFTDQPNNRIHCWSVAGVLSTFLTPAGRANGLMMDRAGQLIACADENNELWRIAPDGQVTVLVRDIAGQRMGGPNDVWVAPSGGLYWSDPLYRRPWWKHTNGWLTARGVYFLPPGTGSVRCVAADLTQPNGLTGTPDGKTLFVSDINARRLYRYVIQPDGALTDRQLFAEQSSDGMTMDERGNLYLTNQRGVTVLAPDGHVVGVIPVPEKWTANVCFGGTDRRTLFITASMGLYAVPMAVRGANPGK